MPGYESLLRSIYTDLTQPVLLVLFVVAIVVFLFGLVELIRDADSSDARDKGKKHIIWGIVGMVIMASAFGIIEIVKDTVPNAPNTIDLLQ